MRCSWLNVVKTSKAKNQIRINCQNKLKEINHKIIIQVFKTFFSKTSEQTKMALRQNLLTPNVVLSEKGFKESIQKLRIFLPK